MIFNKICSKEVIRQQCHETGKRKGRTTKCCRNKVSGTWTLTACGRGQHSRESQR